MMMMMMVTEVEPLALSERKIKRSSGCSVISRYGSSVHRGFGETSLPISQRCDGSPRQLWSGGTFLREVTECRDCVGSVLNPAHSGGTY